MQSFVRIFALVGGVAATLGSAALGQTPVTPTVYSSGAPALQTRSNPPEYLVLRVVRAWYPFETDRGGWPSAVPTKIAPGFRLYEAAVWPDRRSVHLYAFPATFDPDLATAAERERYVIASGTGLPFDNPQALSRALVESFNGFFRIMLERHPGAAFGLSYSGHGSGGGRLFEGMIQPGDAHEMLQSWVNLYGGKLEFIDFGGNCNEAQVSTLASFHPFAHYIVASDLQVGGYDMDEWTIEKWEEVSADIQLARRLRPGKTVLQTWREILDLQRKRWVYSRTNMTTARVTQSRALIDTAAFARFIRELYTRGSRTPGLVSTPASQDLFTYLSARGENELAGQLRSSLAYFVSNRDFFAWPGEAFGINLDNPTVNALLTILDAAGGSAKEAFGQDVFLAGTRAVLTATPQEGRVLAGWDVNGTLLAGTNPVQVMILAATQIRPVFGNGPPVLQAAVNAADAANRLSSTAWITLYGANLADTSRPWRDSDFENGRLPTKLDGVSVTLNGNPCYVAYISATQINILPSVEAGPGAAEFTLINPAGESTLRVTLNSSSPAFFMLPGTRYPAAVHPDGMLVGRPGANPGLVMRSAKPGGIISIFATGFGALSPDLAGASGLVLTIGAVPASVVWAGPVSPGLYQLNVTVPSLPNGDHPLSATFAGASAQPDVFLAIEN